MTQGICIERFLKRREVRILGRLYYALSTTIPLGEFCERLTDAPVQFETDYRWRYPIVRLVFDDLKLVAKTNVDRHVVKLKPVEAHTERHYLFAEAIAALFGKSIVIDDWSNGGMHWPWMAPLLHLWNQPDTAARWYFTASA